MSGGPATRGKAPGLSFFGEITELAKKVYVGNLSFDATEQQVRDLFSEYGTVDSVSWITDRDTGRFRGIDIVEMEN